MKGEGGRLLAKKRREKARGGTTTHEEGTITQEEGTITHKGGMRT